MVHARRSCNNKIANHCIGFSGIEKGVFFSFQVIRLQQRRFQRRALSSLAVEGASPKRVRVPVQITPADSGQSGGMRADEC